MSMPPPERAKWGSRSSDGSRIVRRRLWVAMLALAFVLTVAGVVVTSSLLSDPAQEQRAGHDRSASEATSRLVAREQAIETRLLSTAATPSLARLASDVSGASERKLAGKVLADLRGGEGSIIKGACIVRSSDGKRILLAGRQRSGAASPCVGDALRRSALAAPAGSLIRASPEGQNGSHRLLLVTPLRSGSGRSSSVLSVELDVAALLDRTRLDAGDPTTSMLVDMGSSEIVAATAPRPAPVGGVEAPGEKAIAELLAGIVSGRDDSARSLALLGLTSTIGPLWEVDRGSSLGLVQLWPDAASGLPPELSVALIALVIGAIVAAIALVRYFLDPFEEMEDSKARLQALYREARRAALIDGLTGLGNHRAFQEELTRQVAVFEQRGAPFSLVLMDLDDLKPVNDRDGHAAGDDMLQSMAQTMRDLARDEDRLFRVGGDEFAILMPNTDIGGAVSMAERMLHFCKRPASGARPSPFSSGVSGVPYFSRDRDMLYRQADAALYWAKRHGRGSVETFEPERDQLPDNVADLAGNAVQEVVIGKLLRPVFQPLVDLRSGRILGFEGLIRPDPTGPLPDTDRLFAAAAASGRTVELDLACIEVVVAGAHAIGPDRLLTLNLSPRTLEVKDFDAGWLLESLVRNGISPSRVIIELTEREEVDDLRRLQQTFTNLQQYGLRLAADDVGAGNSGLRLLSQVQFDIVKIDLSLVHDGVRHLGSRAVLRSLRDLALSQKARIVAEGVETPRQLQVIRELDIGTGQGFLLGRPDASVEKTFVDLQRFGSTVMVPAPAAAALRLEAAEPPAAVAREQLRRPSFVLSPGPSFETEPA